VGSFRNPRLVHKASGGVEDISIRLKPGGSHVLEARVLALRTDSPPLRFLLNKFKAIASRGAAATAGGYSYPALSCRVHLKLP
jgi:hypothetical protein